MWRLHPGAPFDQGTPSGVEGRCREDALRGSIVGSCVGTVVGSVRALAASVSEKNSLGSVGRVAHVGESTMRFDMAASSKHKFHEM